jgi:hypothetical protein
MKPIIAGFLLLTAGASAAPLPNFTPGHLALPPLSLRDAARAALPPALPEIAPFATPELRRALPQPRMRIIEPRGNPDPHMAFTPDPRVDYKLRILRPSEIRPGR